MIPSIFKKDNGRDSIFFMIELIFRSQKMSDSIEKPMIEFPTLPAEEVEEKKLEIKQKQVTTRLGQKRRGGGGE